MPENKCFPPEGSRVPETFSLSFLRDAMETHAILEAPVQRCDAEHTLHLSLGGIQGRIPREEAVAPWMSGAERDIAVLAGRVTRLESFGAFVDIGCGIVAMLPIEHISVSRISHPGERFQVGDKILTAVLAMDRERKRITLTHKELLGTWMENASRFRPGETVRGTVRSVKEYGSFIELTPNLSGLADARELLSPGDGVSVYI